MNDYEKEMQEQAEYIARYKTRKEIKKKLRELRKKVKAVEASLPHLQTISRRLDDVENPLDPCTISNPDEKLKKSLAMTNPPTPLISRLGVKSFKETYEFPSTWEPAQKMEAKGMVAQELAKDMGRKLLEEGGMDIREWYDEERQCQHIELVVNVMVDDR
jgi:hypothetical protein